MMVFRFLFDSKNCHEIFLLILENSSWCGVTIQKATFGNQKASSKQIKSMSDKTDTPEILAENLHKWITEIMKFKGYGSAKKCPTKEDLKRY